MVNWNNFWIYIVRLNHAELFKQYMNQKCISLYQLLNICCINKGCNDHSQIGRSLFYIFDGPFERNLCTTDILKSFCGFKEIGPYL